VSLLKRINYSQKHWRQDFRSGIIGTSPKERVMKQEFKILLLESDEDSAELVEFELNLAETRFRLERASDQGSFLWALEELHPHLIMVDSQMRLPDGLTALALARDLCLEVPVFYISGDMRPHAKESGDAALVQHGRKVLSWPKTRSIWCQRETDPSLEQ
jgi:PleD family two-component response regulator